MTRGVAALRVRVLAVISPVVLVASLAAQPSGLRGPMLDAHNCYPEAGQWRDRLSRALSTGVTPIGIEQDLAWKSDGRGGGVSVVAHDTPLRGDEPTLERYFFDALAPRMEAALAANRRETWPLVVLHFDFKTNEPEHHQAVLALLQKYRRWLTTAPRGVDARPQPLVIGPMLVLTEAGEGQERDFFTTRPADEPLMIFGTVPPVSLTASDDRDAQWDAAIGASPERLLPAGATNYRRWANFGWSVVERGGQRRAGDWAAADAARLKAIVDRAHALGLWIRFYTLDGYGAGEGRGWGESYNFGSHEAVEARWRGAIAAGVDFIATDQYEDFASAARAFRSRLAPRHP